MLSSLNVTDIAVGVLCLLGMIGGIRRGLSGELLRIIMIGTSVFAGWTMASSGATYLQDYLDWAPGQRMTLSFFGIIAASYIALIIIRLGLRFVIDFKFKGKLEFIGGALIGLTRSALFCSVVILGLLMPDYEPITRTISTSHAGAWVVKYVQPHYQKLIEENPEFNFPASPETAIESLDVPEIPESSEVLGPIIDADDEYQGEE